jgi:hypothetical protein
MLGTFALTTYEMRVQSEVVEMGNRAKLGRWLRSHARPGEVVYLECVGYIGYFSGARMADWPGLVSPSVVRIAREEGADFYTVVPRLKPDWIVLRPWEAGEMARRIPSFGRDYEQAADFNASARLGRYSLPGWARPLAGGAPLPGIGYLSYDARFLVYRRKRAASGRGRRSPRVARGSPHPPARRARRAGPRTPAKEARAPSLPQRSASVPRLSIRTSHSSGP